MPKTATRDRILALAHEIIAEGGHAALSFDAVARRLGTSKQAVLYWFPTRQALLAALFLPWLAAEAEVVETVLADAPDRATAIRRFVTAIAQHHLADPDRFRLMYLAPQMDRGRGEAAPPDLSAVHPVTARLYSALAAHLDPASPDAARPDAMAIHAATLGLVMMLSLGEALGDPLKHPPDTLVAALADRLAA